MNLTSPNSVISWSQFFKAAVLVMLTQPWSPTQAETIIQPTDFTIEPGFASRNFDHLFDLTAADVSLRYTIDLSSVIKDVPDIGPFIEVGLREQGAANINPGVFGQHPGGKGGWMISAVRDLATDPAAFDVDDKHNLQSAGDLDETKYDALSPSRIAEEPFGTLENSVGILFDRDGVASSEDGSHANTLGKYEIEVDFHAISPSEATMFARVNGLSQGFLMDGSETIEPAGASFTGDMTRMQIFLGSLMKDGTGTIRISNLTVSSTPVPEPTGWILSIAGLCLLGMAVSRRG